MNDLYMCVPPTRPLEYCGMLVTSSSSRSIKFLTDLGDVRTALSDGYRVFKLNSLQEIDSVETTHVEKIKNE